MNFDRMRSLLLAKAIRGELVPQFAKEGAVDQIGAVPEQVPFAIPEKWKWVRLSDLVLKHLGGGTPSKLNASFWNGDIPWASVKDLKGTVLSTTQDSITEEGLNNSSSNLIPAGTVIVCTRMGLGKVAINTVPVAINQDLRALFLSEKIDKNYFLHFYSGMNIEGAGTTVKGIKLTELLNLPISLPPVEEQIRIVAKLEEAFAEIDRAEKAYEELQTLAGVLRGQILQEAIQGKLVPQLVSDGVTKQIAEAPEEVPFDIPNTWSWIRGEELAVKRKTIDPSTLTNDEIELWSIPAYDAGVAEKVSPGDIGSSKKVVQAGDVLLAKIVPHIERVWIVSESANSLMKLASTEWLVYASELFLPEFMGLLFRSPYFRTKMMESVSGMGSLKRANPRTLAKVWLPVPPIKEQERIVIKVETLLKQVNLLLTK